MKNFKHQEKTFLLFKQRNFTFFSFCRPFGPGSTEIGSVSKPVYHVQSPKDGESTANAKNYEEYPTESRTRCRARYPYLTGLSPTVYSDSYLEDVLLAAAAAEVGRGCKAEAESFLFKMASPSSSSSSELEEEPMEAAAPVNLEDALWESFF